MARLNIGDEEIISTVISIQNQIMQCMQMSTYCTYDEIVPFKDQIVETQYLLSKKLRELKNSSAFIEDKEFAEKTLNNLSDQASILRRRLNKMQAEGLSQPAQSASSKPIEPGMI